MHHNDIHLAITPSVTRLRPDWQRRWGALCILLIAFTFTFASQAVAAVISRGEFQITVPDDWTPLDVPVPLQYGARSPDGATIQLGLFKFTPPIGSLDESRLQSFKRGFVKKASRVVGEKTTTVANRAALQFELEVTKGEDTIPFSTWIVLGDAAVYIFMLDMPDSAERTALLDSIRFNAAAPLPAGVPEVKSLLMDPERLGELTGQCLFYVIVIWGVVHYIRRSGRKKDAPRSAQPSASPPPPLPSQPEP